MQVKNNLGRFLFKTLVHTCHIQRVLRGTGVKTEEFVRLDIGEQIFKTVSIQILVSFIP